MAEIKTYAGCSFGVSDDENIPLEATYTYTSVQGQWQRSSQIWADGYHLYIFWGDVQGQVTFFDLETTSAAAATATLACATYNTPSDFTLYQGISFGAPPTSVCKIQGCYSFGLESKKFKQIGDVFTIEGGTEYKIFYTPT